MSTLVNLNDPNIDIRIKAIKELKPNPELSSDLLETLLAQLNSRWYSLRQQVIQYLLQCRSERLVQKILQWILKQTEPNLWCEAAVLFSKMGGEGLLDFYKAAKSYPGARKNCITQTSDTDSHYVVILTYALYDKVSDIRRLAMERLSRLPDDAGKCNIGLVFDPNIKLEGVSADLLAGSPRPSFTPEERFFAQAYLNLPLPKHIEFPHPATNSRNGYIGEHRAIQNTVLRLLEDHHPDAVEGIIHCFNLGNDYFAIECIKNYPYPSLIDYLHRYVEQSKNELNRLTASQILIERGYYKTLRFFLESVLKKEYLSARYLKGSTINSLVARISDSYELESVMARILMNAAEEEVCRFLKYLGQTGHPNTIRYFQTILKKPSLTLQVVAANQLSQFRRFEDIPLYLSYLDHPSARLRFAALRGLRKMPYVEIIQPLFDYIAQEKLNKLRYQAIYVLLHHNSRTQATQWEKLLADQDAYIVKLANEALKGLS